VDFDQMVHDLEWEGDGGLENLWGLYYKFPEAQFIQSFKSLSTTKEYSPVLASVDTWTIHKNNII